MSHHSVLYYSELGLVVRVDQAERALVAGATNLEPVRASRLLISRLERPNVSVAVLGQQFRFFRPPTFCVRDGIRIHVWSGFKTYGKRELAHFATIRNGKVTTIMANGIAATRNHRRIRRCA